MVAVHVDLSPWQVFLSVTSALVALKVLLMPAYTSTDFEVHRNWMAVTHNLPLSKWYYEETSEWTLDYPPFFAYFEKCLATIAYRFGMEDILAIRRESLYNSRVLCFQRLSVIATDVLYILSCVLLCFSDSPRWKLLPKKLEEKARIATFILLACNAGLFMVDNIHFQYNSMLTTFLVLSLYCSDCGHYLLSALFYCVLLNFKHIYLYYAPAYVVFFLRSYFFTSIDDLFQFTRTIVSGLKLAVVMSLPFAVSFGPFIVAGGLSGLLQILSRLFPVSRGLTHAYWAPNFWAMYNVMDFILYQVLSLWKPGFFSPPTYSSGLVQVYDHSVLPTITPLFSLMCVIASLVPLLATLFKSKLPDLCTLLSLSAFSFFFYGYHVHEKALLLMAIPLVVLALTDPKFVRLAVLFSIITCTSLFPLLFTLFEIPMKYCLATTYTILMLLMFRYAFHLNTTSILPLYSILYISGLVLFELNASFVHKAIFGEKLAFLPLMMISVYSAVGVLGCYIWLILLVFDDDIMITFKKKRCELVEGFIKAGHYPVQAVESLEEVEMIGGIDISTSKKNQDFAVVAFSIFEYPSMKEIALFDTVVVISEPYITDYLAIREAAPVAGFVNSILEEFPDLRPDVIICDGNGQFHSRGCGLACHIGALTGIATIGVAKNLNLSLLKSLGASDDIIAAADQLVAKVSSQKSDGFAPFDVILPVVMNITRLGGSKVPVYVSAGYGIELELATSLVLSTAENRICKPIRTADLHSRDKVREYFDG
ncbi:deoxyribonuclease V [Ancylostoma caninum]|uniref:Alpha-1,3-glucosyltransferase n=1 Tax=Ancylostoma caninum TaxID=29170 RepID=A0A368FRQ3_ANCCA|nr:deoxyribonuclease V [Ancylostoma caninum]